MKNILILSAEKDHEYSDKIRDYILEKGVECTVAGWNELTSGKNSLSETIINRLGGRGIRPKDTLIHTRTAGKRVSIILSKLENMGFNVVNGSLTATLTGNKYLTQIFAREKGILTTPTYLVDKKDVALLSLLIRKEKKVVMKPVYSKGKGMYCYLFGFMDDLEGIKKKIRYIPGHEIIVQKYVNYKKLIRVIRIGDKLLKSASTYDEPGKTWKCSVCENPNIKVLPKTSKSLEKLSEKIARAFRLNIGFIDIFETVDGSYIMNEINTACDLSIHEEKTGIQIYKKIGDYLISLKN